MPFILQIINSITVILMLGIPIVITVIFLKKFANKPKSNEDYLLEKIRELENRIKYLEDNQ